MCCECLRNEHERNTGILTAKEGEYCVPRVRLKLFSTIVYDLAYSSSPTVEE